MLKVNAEEGNTDEENVLVRIYQRECNEYAERPSSAVDTETRNETGIESQENLR